MEKTFAIATLGCKVNAVESDQYIQTMNQANYKQVNFENKADIVIINTCAVTHAAAAKSRKKIATAIKNNPKARIVVVGCSLAADFDNIEKFKAIDTLVYQDQKERFGEIVLNQSIRQLPLQANKDKTRAFMKIQDGCEQFCSFCIIPIARGPETSVSLSELLETAKSFVNSHHKEIVLTGIHIGRYGIHDGTSLLELLKELVKIPGLERIRISSIEVTELHDDLLEFIAKQPKIAKHFHIPLQSGSDQVLASMNRPYTMDEFYEKINHIRELMPQCAISSDVIAGFVGESDVDFETSFNNIQKLNFSFLHVFPYSQRKFTKAIAMQGHLESHVIKERTQRLLALSKQAKKQFLNQYINQTVRVLVEHKTKEGYFGHSEHYCPVIIKDPTKANEFVDVQITSVTNSICYGKIVRNDYVSQ